MYRGHLGLLAIADAAAFDRATKENVKELALQDATILAVADRQYGSSWMQRGGVGAYFVGIRKADRMKAQLAKYHDDLRIAVAHDCRAEGIMNDLRDLRRYFYLWEAQSWELGFRVETLDVPELVHPLWPMEGFETMVKVHQYDIFKTFEGTRNSLMVLRYWRRLLLRWEYTLAKEGLLVPLTPLETQHAALDLADLPGPKENAP